MPLEVDGEMAQHRPRSYPNEWLQQGRVLTWFLRQNDWKAGTSRLAQKLLATKTTTAASSSSSSSLSGDNEETNALANGDALPTTFSASRGGRDNNVILFVRMGKGHFLCCGRCLVTTTTSSLPTKLSSVQQEHEEEDDDGREEWDLVKLYLHLLDWDQLQPCSDFRLLVNHPK